MVRFFILRVERRAKEFRQMNLENKQTNKNSVGRLGSYGVTKF